MGSLLYFVTGFDETPARAVELAGLAEVTGARPTGLPIDRGPDGRPGWILPHVYRKTGDLVDYLPERQRWSPEATPGGQPTEVWSQADYWIGFDREDPPGPRDLLKLPPAKIYGGADVRLLDGNLWHIPWVSLILTKFQRPSAETTLEDLGGIAKAAEFVGINYLVGATEIMALGLLDEPTALEVLQTYLSKPGERKPTLPAWRGAVPPAVAGMFN